MFEPSWAFAPTAAPIQDLREKREELNRQILKEEEDKAKIQKEHEVWELLLSVGQPSPRLWVGFHRESTEPQV